MDVFVGALVEAMARLVASVVGLFRRFWPDAEWGRPVEPLRAAAAAGILAIATPLGYVAREVLRLALQLQQDALLLFLALLLVPMLAFAAVLAASGLAAGIAVALGVAVGARGSSMHAWAFVVLGAFQIVVYLQLRWHLLAALTGVATAIEMVVLVCLLRTDHRTTRRPLPI